MRLFELGGMLHTEVMPVPRTDMSCLDDARLMNYIRDILRDPDVPQSTEAWQARLLGLGFLTEAAGNICCTIAGLILFGKNMNTLRVYYYDNKVVKLFSRDWLR